MELKEVTKLIKAEIKSLHDFFQQWFDGSISHDQFIKLENALHKDFTLIPPTGVIIQRDSLISSLKNAFNKRDDLDIRTEMIEVGQINSETYLAKYYEIQKSKESETKRISSAIFIINPRCPNNLEWYSVHETWSK